MMLMVLVVIRMMCDCVDENAIRNVDSLSFLLIALQGSFFNMSYPNFEKPKGGYFLSTFISVKLKLKLNNLLKVGVKLIFISLQSLTFIFVLEITARVWQYSLSYY